MSIGKIIFYVGTIIILSIILIVMLTKGPSQNEVERQILNANFCGSKEDCAPLESKCPLECHILVNQGEKESIQQVIDEFDSDCAYSCTQILDYDCISNQCQVTRSE